MADNNLVATIIQGPTIVADIKATGAQGVQGPQGPQGEGSNLRTSTWVLQNPSVGGVPGPYIEEDFTVTKVQSYTTLPTSVAFNIEKRSAVGIAGTDLMSSDQVADINGEAIATFSDNNIPAGYLLWLDISGVVGTPGILVVTLSGTV